MKKCLFTLAFVAQLSGVCIHAQNCKEVVGYYPDWQWYDRSQLVNPMNIDYSQYTILNYCFFQPMANGTIQLGDSWAEQNLLQGQFDWNTNTYIPNTSVVDRAHNAQVKVLVSIGGWTWSTNFPSIAADAQKRATFAHDCNYYVQYYNLDGIDIDWEYPGNATESANYTLLLQQIRDSLDALESIHNEQYLLTIAVGAAPSHMQNVQWNNVVPLVDMINLMSYDYFGAWDANANHNSPLYAPACGDTTFNIHSSFTRLTTMYNVPAGKINIGVAFYGRTQTGFTSLCSSTSGNAATSAFPPDGVPLYYQIESALPSYNQHWDNSAEVPWLDGNGVFVSYDDPASIAMKAQYINTYGARGAIIWEITGDYIETAPGSGIISGTPLVDTLNTVFCQNTPLTVNSNQQNNVQLTCYPVPASQMVNVTCSGMNAGKAMISIIDVSGRIISSMQVVLNGETQTVQLDISNIASGAYLISLGQNDQNKTVPIIITDPGIKK